mgnify:CR=1 FL=1
MLKTPILEAVQAAKTEYDRLLELTSELSDAIEAAALTSRIDNKAVPAFPVTADLDYIYTHLEKLQINKTCLYVGVICLCLQAIKY